MEGPWREEPERGERDLRESLGAGRKRQRARRKEGSRAPQRARGNITETKTLGAGTQTGLSFRGPGTWPASSDAPPPSPAARGFPGSSLFLERAKRLPDAGASYMLFCLRGPPPLPCAAPHAHPPAGLTLPRPRLHSTVSAGGGGRGAEAFPLLLSDHHRRLSNLQG